MAAHQTVPGILQARRLEWVAISFSSAWKWNEHLCIQIIYLFLCFIIAFSLSFFGMFSRKFRMLIYTAMIILEVSWKLLLGFSCGSGAKESVCNEGDLGLIPGFGRSPGEGEATHPVFWPGEFHGLIVHGVTKSQIWLSDFHFTWKLHLKINISDILMIRHAFTISIWMKWNKNNIRDSLWEEKEHSEIWVRLGTEEALMAREGTGACERAPCRETNCSYQALSAGKLLLLWVPKQAERGWDRWIKIAQFHFRADCTYGKSLFGSAFKNAKLSSALPLYICWRLYFGLEVIQSMSE